MFCTQLVGIGEDYFPVHLFYGLAQLDKTDGKIVKQHRVTWLAAARSKIVWCLNNTSPKMPLPNAIHHDPCSQWMVGIGQPICQF